MDIEKHISNLKQYIKDDKMIEKDGSDFANFCKGHIDDIQAVLNELEKKDALIDTMVEWINKQDIDEEICKNNITQPELCNEEGTNCRDCIKEYFYKKVEGKE